MTLLHREAGLIAAAAALVADQGTKLSLLYGAGFMHMLPGQSIPLLPFFNLMMVWNPGISYGLFPSHSIWGTAALVTLAVIALTALVYWMWHITSRSLAIGIGLIIGGALGNLIDRLLYGSVADFFFFHALGYGWYIFNVADIAITLGAIAMLYDVLRPAPEA